MLNQRKPSRRANVLTPKIALRGADRASKILETMIDDLERGGHFAIRPDLQVVLYEAGNAITRLQVAALFAGGED